MHYIIKNTLDFILPPLCPVTGNRVEAPGLLSAEAWESLNFIEAPMCHHCGAPQHFHGFDGAPQKAGEDLLCAVCLTDPPHYDSLRSIWKYNDVSSQLIMRFKHGDQLHLVRSFVPLLNRVLVDMPVQPSIVVPVPLHRFRLLKRLYNQAGILAQGLSKQSNGTLEYRADVLLRHKHTKSQGHMLKEARKKNVRNAFTLSDHAKDVIKGKHVLLIDDVYTSGATVNACAKILKEKGEAARVDVLTLARVLRDF